METAASTSSLKSVFRQGRALVNELDRSDLASADPIYQEKVKKAIAAFTTANVLVSRLALFSQNETLDDVATAHMPYLLAHAYLGDLYNRVSSEPEQRPRVLQSAETAWTAYLDLCEDYGLMRTEDLARLQAHRERAEAGDNGQQRPKPPTALQQRDIKLDRYKREKEARAKLAILLPTGRNMNDDDDDEDGDAGDDEDRRRELTLTVLDLQMQQAFTQMELIAEERTLLAGLLEARAARAAGGALPPPPLSRPTSGSAPLKPIVIKDVKAALREQVFQPGWRQPTMTLDEFVELERQRGNIITGGGPEGEARQQREKEAREMLDADVDADAATYKARQWDEYTDDNRRGSGNQYNRS